MRKVLRLNIDSSFSKISATDLMVGTVVNFDIYLQRFNGFVIVIAAQTRLTDEVVTRLLRVDNVHIKLADKKKFDTYKADFPAVEKLFDLDTMQNVGQSAEDDHKCKELSSLYEDVCGSMRHFYESGTEELPLDAIHSFIVKIMDCIDDTMIKHVLMIMPEAYTFESHSVNVGIFSAAIGARHGMHREAMHQLLLAGILHDIGKVRLDQQILNKRASLEKMEFEQVKEHSVLSEAVAKANGIRDNIVLNAIRHHHERLDGSGYPDGLRGKKILPFAQIVGICDAFDAMTTNKTYRQRYRSFNALLLMKREMLSQFNAGYVASLITILRGG